MFFLFERAPQMLLGRVLFPMPCLRCVFNRIPHRNDQVRPATNAAELEFFGNVLPAARLFQVKPMHAVIQKVLSKFCQSAPPCARFAKNGPCLINKQIAFANLRIREISKNKARVFLPPKGKNPKPERFWPRRGFSKFQCENVRGYTNTNCPRRMI